MLRGLATIDITAKQDLSSFNLDLHGLTVRTILIDGPPARWSPQRRRADDHAAPGIRRGEDFTALIAYDGVPETIGDAEIGLSGFIHTDDGTLVAGQPDVAATWYPVNDHPLDKASYSFRILVPRGLEAIANGELQGVDNLGPVTLWRWEAKEPMASYLTTATIGEFDVKQYKTDGIKVLDAIDPDLDQRPAPRTGRQFAISGIGEPSYKRLARTINVPAERRPAVVLGPARHRAQLGLLLRRGAHRRPGRLDDAARPQRPQRAGHGRRVLRHLQLYPFLERYLTLDFDDFECAPTGTTGELVGRERPQRRLRAVDGRPLEVARQARSRSR